MIKLQMFNANNEISYAHIRKTQNLNTVIEVFTRLGFTNITIVE